jgi:hypothetical protein
MHAPSAGLLNLKKEEAILSQDYENKYGLTRVFKKY